MPGPRKKDGYRRRQRYHHYNENPQPLLEEEETVEGFGSPLSTGNANIWIILLLLIILLWYYIGR